MWVGTFTHVEALFSSVLCLAVGLHGGKQITGNISDLSRACAIFHIPKNPFEDVCLPQPVLTRGCRGGGPRSQLLTQSRAFPWAPRWQPASGPQVLYHRVGGRGAAPRCHHRPWTLCKDSAVSSLNKHFSIYHKPLANFQSS